MFQHNRHFQLPAPWLLPSTVPLIQHVPSLSTAGTLGSSIIQQSFLLPPRLAPRPLRPLVRSFSSASPRPKSARISPVLAMSTAPTCNISSPRHLALPAYIRRPVNQTAGTCTIPALCPIEACLRKSSPGSTLGSYNTSPFPNPSVLRLRLPTLQYFSVLASPINAWPPLGSLTEIWSPQASLRHNSVTLLITLGMLSLSHQHFGFPFPLPNSIFLQYFAIP
jgi:hypothetical protein